MPHLFFRGRYYIISDDDLFIPLTCTIIGRTFWVGLIILYLILEFPLLERCASGNIIAAYLFVLVISSGLIAITDAVLLAFSIRGTIVETEPRRMIIPLLAMRVYLSYSQIIFVVYGIFAVSYADHIPCYARQERTATNRAIIIVFIFSQLFDISVLTCCGYISSSSLQDPEEERRRGRKGLQPLERRRNLERSLDPDYGQEEGSEVKNTDEVHRTNSGQQEPDASSTTERWGQRFKYYLRQIEFYSCNLLGSGNVNEELQDVAKVLTKFFHHEGFLNIVPSDIVAGIILVRNEQKWIRRQAFEQALKTSIEVHDPRSELIRDEENPLSEEERKSITEILEEEQRHSTKAIGNSESMLKASQQMDEITSQQYEGGTKKIATLPLGTLKEIPQTEAAVNDISFLYTVRRYLIYAAMIYNRLILVDPDKRQNQRNTDCWNSCCNCTACMSSEYEGIRINYCYLYGTKARQETSPHYQQDAMNMEEKSEMTIEGMNFYATNFTMIRSVILEKTELIHVSFRSDFLHKPYAIFLDHEEEKVVISIRGTLSIEDAITDIECESVAVR